MTHRIHSLVVLVVSVFGALVFGVPALSVELSSMDRAAFWQIIDATRREANNDPGMQVDRLRAALRRLSAQDVLAFHRTLTIYHARTYDWNLWGASYVIGGGRSDDGFYYFGLWLISKGEAVYEDALRDPETLVAVILPADGDCELEAFGYVPGEVWREKTGDDDISDDAFPPGSAEGERIGQAIGNPTGELWADEAELQARFPKLWQRFSQSPGAP
jgi:hypothetical protein